MTEEKDVDRAPVQEVVMPLYRVGLTFREYSIKKFVRAETPGKAVQCVKNTINFEHNYGPYNQWVEVVDDSRCKVFEA